MNLEGGCHSFTYWSFEIVVGSLFSLMHSVFVQIQARKEREALAAEGGWTVVEHHKGRKKTIEAESGTAVVSVAGAAVMDKMGKKKNKEVGVDFYRFQKREAQRNGIVPTFIKIYYRFSFNSSCNMLYIAPILVQILVVHPPGIIFIEQPK